MGQGMRQMLNSLFCKIRKIMGKYVEKEKENKKIKEI